MNLRTWKKYEEMPKWRTYYQKKGPTDWEVGQGGIGEVETLEAKIMQEKYVEKSEKEK